MSKFPFDKISVESEENPITVEYLAGQRAELGEAEFTTRAINGAVQTLGTLMMLTTVCAMAPDDHREAAAKSLDYATKLAEKTAQRLVASLRGEWAEVVRLHNEGLAITPPTEAELGF